MALSDFHSHRFIRTCHLFNVLLMQKNITLALRSPGKITLGNIKSTYCQLTDSHGVKLPLTIGNCEYDIAIVTTYYDGLWKARYGLKGRLVPVEVNVMVNTYGETFEPSNERSETDAKRTFPSRGNLLLSIHKGPRLSFQTHDISTMASYIRENEETGVLSVISRNSRRNINRRVGNEK